MVHFEEVDGAYWFRVVCACMRASVCPSVHQEPCMHARVLKFHIWIPHGKIVDTHFFLDPAVSLSEVMPLWKNLNEIWCMHILRTVHARVLKFHIWISHGKIADPYFFSCSSYLPFWSYAALKNQNEILSARYLKKYLSQGLETRSADWRWWIDYLIKLKKKFILFFRSYGPLKILAF